MKTSYPTSKEEWTSWKEWHEQGLRLTEYPLIWSCQRKYPYSFNENIIGWNKVFAIKAGWYRAVVMRYQFIKKEYPLLL